jgi:hypothetical protein
MAKPPLLIVDATGLGAPVVQRAREVGLTPIGLTITGGENPSLRGRDWTCPKGVLVGELRMVMHRKLLKVASGFPARETLQNELAVFTARLSPSGRATFEAAGSEHDDTCCRSRWPCLRRSTGRRKRGCIRIPGFWSGSRGAGGLGWRLRRRSLMGGR